MNKDSIQIILLFYIGTVLVNLIISVIQWLDHKGPVQKYLFWYWITLIISAAANSLPIQDNLLLSTISGLGTFLSQWILGSALISCTLIESNNPFLNDNKTAFSFNSILKSQFSKYSLLLYLTGTVFGLLLNFFQMPFEVFATPMTVGAASPFLIAVYTSFKHRSQSYSLAQKSFIVVGVLMTLHYYDWPYFRPRPEFFAVGLLIAFSLLHILSILTPILANEYSLLIRTLFLENEVATRAEQIKANELQLAHSNKLASLGRMAGGVSHEINTPLSIISMYAENLLSYEDLKKIPPFEFKKSMEKIILNTERISKITSALRKVSRDQLSTEKEKTNLNQLISDTVSFSNSRVVENEIRLTTEFPSETIECFYNPIEISQILMNLLNNAIEALSKEPLSKEALSKEALSKEPLSKEALSKELPSKEALSNQSTTLSTQLANEPKKINVQLGQIKIKNEMFAQIKVIDSGKIAAEIAEKIMDPFFTTKDIGKGTGLGLSISLSIAKNHGGNLYLDQNANSTTFVLELPNISIKSLEAGLDKQSQ